MQITLTYQNPYQAHVYTHIQEIYDFKSVSNEQFVNGINSADFIIYQTNLAMMMLFHYSEMAVAFQSSDHGLLLVWAVGLLSSKIQ